MIPEALAFVGAGATFGVGCGFLCLLGLEGAVVSSAEEKRMFAQLVQEATELAADYNLRLTLLDAEDRNFRLELIEGTSLATGSGAGAERVVFSCLLWPTMNGADQVKWESDHRVPLALPSVWTVMDAVEAAIRRLTGEPDPDGCRSPKLPRQRKRPVTTAPRRFGR